MAAFLRSSQMSRSKMVASVVTEGGGVEGGDERCMYVYSVRRETTEVPYSAVRKPQHGRNEQ